MNKSLARRERPAQPDPTYYKQMWKKARSYQVGMAKKVWCDYSHQHLDWNGLGNRSWLDRRRHLAALLHAFNRAQRELLGFSGPYQVFASVTPADSASDAVYVHTPNPNGTPFPMKPLGVRVSSLPPLLAGRIDPSRYEVFRHGSGPSASYTILVPMPER